jgi:hypothetical protein
MRLMYSMIDRARSDRRKGDAVGVDVIDGTATTTVVGDWAAAGPSAGSGDVLAYWRRQWYLHIFRTRRAHHSTNIRVCSSSRLRLASSPRRRQPPRHRLRIRSRPNQHGLAGRGSKTRHAKKPQPRHGAARDLGESSSGRACTPCLKTQAPYYSANAAPRQDGAIECCVCYYRHVDMSILPIPACFFR